MLNLFSCNLDGIEECFGVDCTNYKKRGDCYLHQYLAMIMYSKNNYYSYVGHQSTFGCRMCTAKGQYAAGASNKNGVYFLNTEVDAYRTIEELKNGDLVSDKNT
jgi:hypothetical protein